MQKVRSAIYWINYPSEIFIFFSNNFTILFGKYSGQEIKLDGEEYLIMREDEVLGVVQ